MESVEGRNKLQNELFQYREIQRILCWLNKKTKKFKQAKHRNKNKRLTNQFGRWLMVLQYSSDEHQKLDERFPLMPAKSDCVSSETRAEFVKYFRLSYPNMSNDEATDLMDGLPASVDRFLLRQNQRNKLIKLTDIFVSYKEDEDGQGQLRMGTEFSTPFSKQVKKLVDKCDKYSAALVCLRYHSLSMFTGGECSLGTEVFNILCQLGQVRYEGFSSPLNCQLLDKQDAKFCSLFPDIDSIFGSLGNFFHINLMQHPGGWLLSPPFVEGLLKLMAKRVVQVLDAANQQPDPFWFFIFCPHWTDCSAWEILNESTWKRYRHDFQRYQLQFQDCYGKRLGQQTTICLFALGDLPDTIDFDMLCEAMTEARKVEP